ncbi:hypothetical protein EV359DRAFT_86957 [Lentinula novae-zelandiae]|nr:hypothetical protein EV359DRAFT_86957 [Lentinula novae-zelandiae]
MNFTPPTNSSGAPNPVSPPALPLSGSHPAEMTVDAAINELSNTIEEPPLGQLALFRSVFGVGVSLARYIVDDPLRPLLAAAGLPCSFCVRVTATIRDPAFWWRDIAAKIETSTNSTVALIELNALDEQDQQELDRLELGEFLRKQPQLPRPSATSSLPPPIPSVAATPRALAKKRKRSVRQEEGGSSSLCKHPVGELLEPEVAPEVHDRKRKHPAGESRDAEVPDYRRVVLVLCRPFVDTSGSAPLSGGRVNEMVHSPPPSVSATGSSNGCHQASHSRKPQTVGR